MTVERRVTQTETPAYPADPVVAPATRTSMVAETATVTPSGGEMGRRIVTLIFGIIQVFIVLRIVLLLLDAREGNGLVSFILDTSQIFVAPFVEEASKTTVLFWLAILLRYQWVSRLSGIVLAGLSGAAFAFTENGRRANLIGDLVESGMVGINTFAISLADAPFGGVKDSGFGSEGGKEGLESYQVVKAIHQA